MKLLLDTHVFVWAVTDDPRLAAAARSAIVDGRNSLVVSSASAWEMSIKAASGKWPDAVDMLEDVPLAIGELGADVLPIGVDHALRAGAMPWEHRDPFDRMLAAQALTERATLVTADRAFADSGADLLPM